MLSLTYGRVGSALEVWCNISWEVMVYIFVQSERKRTTYSCIILRHLSLHPTKPEKPTITIIKSEKSVLTVLMHHPWREHSCGFILRGPICALFWLSAGQRREEEHGRTRRCGVMSNGSAGKPNTDSTTLLRHITHAANIIRFGSDFRRGSTLNFFVSSFFFFFYCLFICLRNNLPQHSNDPLVKE